MLELEAEIQRRIQAKGRITFAEFMDLALFWPRGGYYASPDRIGAAGDFYTAPGAHPAFGALLAVQLHQMWQDLDRPRLFHVVEMGAGGGLLCRDILTYSANLPDDFVDSLRYLCLDRHATPGQEASLKPPLRARAQRLAATDLPLKGIVGCFLSNELVDSFPVHEVVVRDGKLQEVHVTLRDGALAETLDEPSTLLLQQRLDSLGVSLPDGYRTEINLAQEPWMAGVAAALERGFVLTIDYGYTAADYYSPRRSRGTLTCYYRHTQTNNPYVRIGRQDMTAHVEFTSLANVGAAHGLDTLGLVSQERFLSNLGLGQWVSQLRTLGLRPTQLQANRMGMLELVQPEGFGRFKVLAQAKGVNAPRLWGLEGGADLSGLPVPLREERHMPLLEGKYPHEAQEFEAWWPFDKERG